MTAELEILHWIHSFSSPGMDALMLGVTTVSTHAAVWLLAAALLILSNRERRTGCSMVLAVLIAFTIADLVMKPLFCRERPCDLAGFELLVSVPTTYSFPSGHTAMAFAPATVLFLRDRRAGAVALAFAALVGVSRMYLFVHWPTDVVVGALVGIVSGYVAALLTERAAARWGRGPPGGAEG
ncbi:MAG: phosphatase PAP2 family protein [Candidatus Methanomethylophilaceae archaeon]|nr:phosphatase PAP2 family protein [Candidatus Methanomethylophilaceae archaeon]